MCYQQPFCPSSYGILAVLALEQGVVKGEWGPSGQVVIEKTISRKAVSCDKTRCVEGTIESSFHGQISAG